MTGIITVVTVEPSQAAESAYGSLLSYWRANNQRQFIFRCPVNGCSHFAETGAVIRHAKAADDSLYVIPACREHSTAGRILAVPATLTQVPVTRINPGLRCA